MKKIVAIIQARVGSTRLPGKVLLDLKGKTVLNHVVDRVKKSRYINEVIVATTDLEQDDKIVDECNKIGCKYFRGSENDVLSRYYLCGKENDADIVIRITSDCPLIDPLVIDEMLGFYLKSNYTLVTNAGDIHNRTYPRGLDTEIFDFNALENAYKNANKDYQKEHVTPYIYENEKDIYYYKNDIDYSKYRLTLDTKEDFELIKRIYDFLYTDSKNFYLEDIVKVMITNKQLENINSHIKQKALKTEGE